MKEKKIEITKERLERLEGFEQTIDRLKEIGFPTFMSCREYADHIEKLEQDLKHKKIAIQSRKARIKDLEKQIEELKEKHKQDELGLIITNSSARAELEEENKQLKAQIEELKKKADKVVISLKADCNEIGKRACELKKQIEKMKQDLDNARENANKQEQWEIYSVLNDIYNDNFEVITSISN